MNNVDLGSEIIEREPAGYVRTVIKGLDGKPEGVLEFATTRALPCGCDVTGNGTLSFPLTVRHCVAHAQVDKLASHWATMKDQLRRTRDTGFREKTIYALTLMESLESE